MINKTAASAAEALADVPDGATLLVGGFGTAGIPGASLSVIAMILGMLHVPPEGLALIFGVVLSVLAVPVLALGVNLLTAFLADGERLTVAASVGGVLLVVGVAAVSLGPRLLLLFRDRRRRVQREAQVSRSSS